MTVPSTEDWRRREDLLDALLALTVDERDVRLAQIARQSAADAVALRAWLSGIDRSSAYLDPPGGPALASGVVVGAWRLERPIGRGGMGEVWLGARADGLFEKQVAIKFIRDERAALRRSLEAERRVLAGLQHPGIVRLLDAGTRADGHPYLVTDFIEGVTLDAWLARTRPPLAARIALFRGVAAAVAYAHERLVVHRDIKPANVLVDAAGASHLLDFGIARALAGDGADAAATLVALTPEYAAPELAAENVASVRSDIYALGGVLYFLLGGRAPLELSGLPLAPLVEAIRTQEPARIDVAADEVLATAPRHHLADLEAIARKALAKDPDGRYGSVEALLRDVDAALADLPVAARNAGGRDRLRRYLRRHRLALGVGAAMLLTLVTGLAGTLWQAREARLQQARAEREAARALAEAKTANAVRDFLVGVFAAANPEVTLGKMPTLAELVDSGIRRAEVELDDEPALKSQLLAALGETRAGIGDFDHADIVLKHAQAIAAAAFGETSEPTIAIMLRRARAMRRGPGTNADVRAMLESIVMREALATTEQRPLFAGALTMLGEIQGNTGELDQAEANLRRAIALAADIGPAADRVQLEARYHLSAVIQSRDHVLEAVDMMRDALAMPYAQRPDALPITHRIRDDLAGTLGSLGRLDEAEAMRRALIESARAIYGEAHPVYAENIAGLARVLIRKNDLAGAEPLLEEARRIVHDRFGDDNRLMALIYVQISVLRYNQDRLDEALDFNERALAYLLAQDGPRSPRALSMRQNRAQLELERGNYAAAEREALALIADREASAAGVNGNLIQLVGDARRLKGDLAGAQVFHRRALDALTSNGDTASVHVQEVNLAIALDLRDGGDLAGARRKVQAVLDALAAQGIDATSSLTRQARYQLGQLDVLEGHCSDSARPALESEWQRQSTRPRSPMQEWAAAQAGLFVGLCRRQRGDAEGDVGPIAVHARALLASKLADPFSLVQAKRTLGH